jgi:hypothetical protein
VWDTGVGVRRVRWMSSSVFAGRREPLEIVTRDGGLGNLKRDP